MQNIGIDLDGCIADFITEAQQRILNKYNFDILPVLATSPLHKDLEQVDKWLSEVDQEEDIFDNLIPIKNSRECLEILNNKPQLFSVYYISGRPDKSMSQTMQWLDSNKYPLFNGIIFTKNKGKYCRDLSLNFFIEDRPQYVSQILSDSLNTKVLLYDQPWNQNYNFDPSKVKRMYNWSSIIFELLRLEDKK